MKKSLHETVQESLQKAWSEGLASIRTVEEEMARRFQAFRSRADLHQQREEIQRVLADLGRRLQQSSETLEQRVEDNVKGALSRFRVPLVEEIAALRTRVEQLSQRVERRLERRAAPLAEAAPPPTDTDGDDIPH